VSLKYRYAKILGCQNFDIPKNTENTLPPSEFDQPHQSGADEGIYVQVKESLTPTQANDIRSPLLSQVRASKLLD
jgi:hypothetical protein